VRRVLLVVVAALALGGVVGALVLRDPGYLLISYGGVAVETSLWVALLVLVVGVAVLRLLLRLLFGIGRGAAGVRSWRRARRDRNARLQTFRGLQSLAEWRWADARKRLESGAAHADAPLVNHVYAAVAAHHLGDAAGRDELLATARQSNGDAALAVAATQAELLHQAGDWHACLAALGNARRHAPHNARLLALEADCYRHLNDWQAVIERLPELGKQRALPERALAALRREAWLARIRQPGADPAELWRALPREQKRDPGLVAGFARALLEADQAAEAEPILRHALEHGWSAELVRLYGLVGAAESRSRALGHAEGWLKKHPHDAELLLALGRICLGSEQWAKGREYLEASLKLRADPTVQGELGRLCLALGESDRGGELAVQALRELPPLPLPGRGA
jgi:HemY protein